MAGRRPPFVAAERDARPGKRVEVWFQDEARVGQQGTLTTVRDDRGSRPTRVKRTEYQWVHLFAAVNPLTGDSAALVAPHANTHCMAAHLRFVSEAAGPDAHVVLVLDGAGWHASKHLAVPPNVTLLPLPPYSPELNPVERVWRYPRQTYLSNRPFADYDEVFGETTAAWNRLDAATLAFITATAWVRAS